MLQRCINNAATMLRQRFNNAPARLHQGSNRASAIHQDSAKKASTLPPRGFNTAAAAGAPPPASMGWRYCRTRLDLLHRLLLGEDLRRAQQLFNNGSARLQEGLSKASSHAPMMHQQCCSDASTMLQQCFSKTSPRLQQGFGNTSRQCQEGFNTAAARLQHGGRRRRSTACLYGVVVL